MLMFEIAMFKVLKKRPASFFIPFRDHDDFVFVTHLKYRCVTDSILNPLKCTNENWSIVFFVSTIPFANICIFFSFSISGWKKSTCYIYISYSLWLMSSDWIVFMVYCQTITMCPHCTLCGTLFLISCLLFPLLLLLLQQAMMFFRSFAHSSDNFCGLSHMPFRIQRIT